MSLSKKTRFEVFKRDDFTCQYCGRQAPSVILEIDHIVPLSKGGDLTNRNNLVTSCVDCNRGKRDIPLHVKDRIEARAEEAKDYAERQEQLKEYEKYLKQKERNKQKLLSRLNNYWADLCDKKYVLNETGLKSLWRFTQKLSTQEITEAMDISAKRIKGKSEHDIEGRFKYFCGICHNKIAVKSGDEARLRFQEIERYYLSKRKTHYYVKYRLRQIAEDYEKETVLEAIDIALGERQGNYWEAFCDALESLAGEEVPYK